MIDLLHRGRTHVAAVVAAIAAMTTAAAGAAGAADEPLPPDVSVDVPCVPGAGSCFEEREGPGCNWAPCCELVCEMMPECCTSEWDELCVETAFELCEQPPPCEVATQPCEVRGRDGGCRDTDCCSLVCRLDPYCCSAQWDALCVDLADLACPTRSASKGIVFDRIDEQEPCNEPSVNDGCEQSDGEPAFTDLALGTPWVGRSWAFGRRDVDWLRLEVPPGTPLAVRLDAEFPAELVVMQGDCQDGFAAIAWTNVAPRDSGVLDAIASEDGVTYVVVAPGRDGYPILRGIECITAPAASPRTFGNRYRVRVDASSPEASAGPDPAASSRTRAAASGSSQSTSP